MPLTSGTKLGPYEIGAPLGAGGMGEVYRARDIRLERTVAIKILPEHLSSDPVRKQRFDREAKTISSLNHPHICTLHDVGSQDGVDYLVMECVEGETLAKRLEKGPLPLDQVLKYGMQIADALDKAHRSGVVHRDLKPGNIMLTKSGVKLLDFGLAKPVSEAIASGLTVSVSPAKNRPLTEEGAIVGTVQYMSPEQLEGKESDARSDLFSFGALLYEMTTGSHAFDGRSQASVIAAILEHEPKPIATFQPLAPPALDQLIRTCLAKDPEERMQTAHDVKLQLRWMTEAGSQASTAVRAAAPERVSRVIPWLVSLALLSALILVAIWRRSSTPNEQTMYFSAPFPFPARDMAVAPNGHTIAVVAYLESARKNVIWIYELGSTDARSLSGTEDASYPFWSADGASLAFFADGKLKKTGMSGSRVQTISDAPSGRGGTWNKDGVIVFTPSAQLGGGLYRVSASGGTPIQISIPDASRGEQSHRWPRFLPDGKHFLYLATNFAGRKGINSIFVGSLDSKEKRFLVEATGNAAYAAPGYLLYPREKTLLAQRLDLERFGLAGDPITILTELQYQPLIRKVAFAVSDNGLLVAQTGSGVALSQPVWFNRKGNEVGALSKPGVYQNLSIAPNGKSVAVDQTDMGSQSQNPDVWTYELQRDNSKRLTFDPSGHVVPVWSPDASRLLFSSNQDLNFDLYMKRSDGAQEEKSILREDVDKWPNDWSSDGKYILFVRGTDLWFINFADLKTKLFLKAPSVLRNGQFSPDGKWVAYASNETGKWEIYVTSFPEPRGKWQVSTGGGEQPRWRRDGKELFYLSSDYKMMAAPVTTGANFDRGTPIALFQTTPRQAVSLPDFFVYDVSRDGQRFLINTQVKQEETTPMSVVLNWTAKLNK